MGKPAARVGDMHTCPMVTPGTPPIPHVGGPVLPPGKPTVLIGGMPAATMGSMCTCVGPPDSIVLGSMGVFIGGQPAARMGDQCAHGGMITVGCPTVLIGEVGGGGLVPVTVMQSAPVQIAMSKLTPKMKEKMEQKIAQVTAMKDAANEGIFFAHNSLTCPICNKK